MELCKHNWQLTEHAKENVFFSGYRAGLPQYFYVAIHKAHSEKRISTQDMLVYHNHSSLNGKSNTNLDVTFAAHMV